LVDLQYSGDLVNTIGENLNVFSLIQMC